MYQTEEVKQEEMNVYEKLGLKYLTGGRDTEIPLAELRETFLKNVQAVKQIKEK